MLRRSTEKRPPGEVRIRAGALEIPGVRKYIAQSAAQLGSQLGSAQQRFDRWASSVVAMCHKAHQAESKANAKQRELLERQVRERRKAHAIARQAAGRRTAPLPLETSGAGALQSVRAQGQGPARRREAGTARPQHTADAPLGRETRERRGRGGQRQAAQATARQPTATGLHVHVHVMCTRDAGGHVTEEFKGQAQVAAHQREAWRKVRERFST